MTELSPGWEWATIGEVGEVMLGRQRSPKWHNGPNMRPYLRVANVFEDRIDISDVKEMDFPPDQYDRFKLEPGDILLNEGQSPEWLGRPAMYRDELPGACFTNSLIRFRPHVGVDGRFALYLFRHYLRSRRFMKEARITTNIAHLSVTRFVAIEFPLPPLAEQERIVAAIEEHLSRLDAAQDALRSLVPRLGVLRIAASRDALPPTNRILLEVADVLAGATPAAVGQLPQTGDRAFYKVGDMNASDGRWMGRSRTYIGDGSKTAGKLRLWPAGTVIFPKQGGAIATNKKRQLLQPAYCDLNTMGVVPGDELDPDYLYRLLEQVDLTQLSDGSVIQQIKKPAVEGLPVGVPGLAAQREIVFRLDQWDERISSLQLGLKRALKRADALRHSVLAAAFSGNLVPQDPNDEPASVLLERIRAERSATPVKRTRKAKAS